MSCQCGVHVLAATGGAREHKVICDKLPFGQIVIPCDTRTGMVDARADVELPTDRVASRATTAAILIMAMNYSVAAIARAAASGSSAWVIGRPMTSIEAPASIAARGVTTRF